MWPCESNHGPRSSMEGKKVRKIKELMKKKMVDWEAMGDP
jgi:hypothetical protein